MKSFHNFSKAMVVVGVFAAGSIFGATAFDKVKCGFHQSSEKFTVLQPVYVQQVRKATDSDNMATAAATSMYLIRNVNGAYGQMNGQLERKKSVQFPIVACKVGGYALADRALRFLENKASEYGVSQKALIKATKNYLPEVVAEVVEGSMPYVAELLHDSIVTSLVETVAPAGIKAVVSGGELGGSFV